MALSAADAAFEGFRLTREKPLLIAALSLAYLVFGFATAAILVGVAGPALSDMMDLSRVGAASDPQSTLDSFARIGPAYALLLPISVLFYGLLTAAVNRAVLRPEDKGLGYVKLGADEFRVTVAVLVYWIAMAGVYIGGLVGVVLIGAVLGAISPFLGGFAAVVGGCAMLAALVYVGVRLSMAPSVTFVRGRIDLSEAWRLSRGRFWSLLGAYILAWLLAAVVFGLMLLIYTAVVATLGGGMTAMAEVMTPDFSSIGAYFNLERSHYLVFVSGVYGLTAAITTGVVARAYQQLAGPDASAFD